jgi:hypothetical protein
MRPLITDGILLSRFISQFNLGTKLTEEQLTEWQATMISAQMTLKRCFNSSRNIPLVGFHDFLSVLILDMLKIKSSKRPAFTAFMANTSSAPEFAAKITFVEGKLENFDAVIATEVTIQRLF